MQQSNEGKSYILLFDRHRITYLIKKALLYNNFETLEDYAFEYHKPSIRTEELEYDIIIKAISVSLELIESENAINKLLELIDILQSNDDPEKINSTLEKKYGSIDDWEIVEEILQKYIKDKENDK